MADPHPKILTIQKRADFLLANRGLRAVTPGFILLVRTPDDATGNKRVGFTVTRKIGNAVVRNRMKRRLRALAREVLPEYGITSADHVLIGRDSGVERDFAALRDDLLKALDRLRAGKGDSGFRPRKERR